MNSLHSHGLLRKESPSFTNLTKAISGLLTLCVTPAVIEKGVKHQELLDREPLQGVNDVNDVQ